MKRYKSLYTIIRVLLFVNITFAIYACSSSEGQPETLLAISPSISDYLSESSPTSFSSEDALGLYITTTETSSKATTVPTPTVMNRQSPTMALHGHLQTRVGLKAMRRPMVLRLMLLTMQTQLIRITSLPVLQTKVLPKKCIRLILFKEQVLHLNQTRPYHLKWDTSFRPLA